jgi:hypothetical protein
MEALASGTAKTLEVDLTGASIYADATAASYRILDENGATVTATTPVSGYVAGADVATVVVTESENTLSIEATEGAREVLVTLSSATSTETVRVAYRLYQDSLLVVPTTSTVTLLMAEMLAEDMPGVTYWDAATSEDRVFALRAAYMRIGKLLLVDRSRSGWAAKQYAGYGFGGEGFRLFDLSPSEWQSMSAEFKKAMQMGQVAEANAILDTTTDMGGGSVRSIVIGESSRTFFQGGKAPISKGAMPYIGRFLAAGRVGRG